MISLSFVVVVVIVQLLLLGVSASVIVSYSDIVSVTVSASERVGDIVNVIVMC